MSNEATRIIEQIRAGAKTIHMNRNKLEGAEFTLLFRHYKAHGYAGLNSNVVPGMCILHKRP